ncbi:hypothetical protein BKA56DRAFT_365891 [Ilyonectria sp. MPI-CAGE-AT-0026]|nr:hypothetical protein BKA56DRAFT_365891 [Ilyonectria sp. MPI-CAGE-AT-0026]
MRLNVLFAAWEQRLERRLCNLCLILSSLQPPTTDGPVVHNLDTLHRALAFAQVASFKRRRQRRIEPTSITRIGGCVLLAGRESSRVEGIAARRHASCWRLAVLSAFPTHHAARTTTTTASLLSPIDPYNCALGLSQRKNNHYNDHHPSPCGASLPRSFNRQAGSRSLGVGCLPSDLPCCKPPLPRRVQRCPCPCPVPPPCLCEGWRDPMPPNKALAQSTMPESIK